MAKVKRCPFCASIAIGYLDGDEIHYYHCMECGADGPPDDNDNKALKAWNQRPSEFINSDKFLTALYANAAESIHSSLEEIFNKTIEEFTNE